MRRHIVLPALILGLSAVSHADTFTNLSLQNTTFVSGATATGNVTIDTTTGTFTAVSLTYTLGSTVLNFTGAPADQGGFDGNTQYFESSYDNSLAPQYALLLDLPTVSLVGYTGGNLCTTTAACDGYTSFLTDAAGNTDRVSAGSLAGSAITPEPSSFVLLGTGLVGFAGALRRRIVTRS